MANFFDWIKRGTRASQAAAAAANKGTLYWVTDESKLERSSGSAWEAMSASGGLTKIQQIVCSGSQATVDFSSIPAIYSALRVEYIARDTQGGTALTNMRLKINGDATAGNYTASSYAATINGAANNGTVAASVKGFFVLGMPQDGQAAGMAASGMTQFIGYATAWHKHMLGRGGYEDTGGQTTITLTGRWKSIAAINQLTFATDGTAFKDGSVFTLYGEL